MGELKNEFSWSYSRHGVFEECARKYWLNHYGFWGGWGRRAGERERALYVQKKLTNQPMWVGTVVHDLAEGALKARQAGEQPWVERGVEMALQRAREDIEASRAARYLQNPKRHPGFQVHYYGAEEPDWQEHLDEIERQVRVLFEHPVFRRMMQVPERIVEVEVLHQVDIDGVPVWVKLDGLMSDGDGGLVIVDWKTGKAHSNAEVGKQLGVYGIYATQDLGAPIEKVKALHVNLRHNTQVLHPIDPKSLESCRAFVRSSADAMLDRLVDRERNVAREEDFPMLPEGSASCARCRFRGDCGRE